ncbi:hypothetical protein ABT186_11015 [Streptomyces sp. NPDC001634]|uniref:hypothetical protein n=1 Tax=Streptomyces sp. NPDC001634 TaxID=3154390 RepID=UPI00331820F1
MTNKTMSGPVHLPDPTRPPAPTPGCDVCEALDRQRAQAEKAKNHRRATTCEMEIRRHPRHEGQQ